MPTARALRTALLVAASLLAAPAGAQVRRALVVGIDVYAPASPGAVASSRGSWGNLHGAVNDAEAFRDALVQRLGFAPEHVTLLRNGEATRDALVATFRRVLVDEASPGDVTVFFYAGHGSQVLNLASAEEDRLDETLVPADTRLGAPDLRDKELRVLFADAAARTRLTVILDACHSGGAMRGARARTPLADWRERAIPPDRSRDANDPDPGPEPGGHGVVVLAAAEDLQTAGEGRDAQGRPRGFFTLTLLEVLSRLSGDAPADEVFKAVKAAMQRGAQGGEGTQEPILFASPDRAHAPLFGYGSAASAGPSVAVTRIDGERIVLQAGRGLLIGPGTLLRRARGPGQVVRLVVKEVPGISTSVAAVLEGRAADVAEGDVFAVERWVPPPEGLLRVAIDPGVGAALARSVAAKLGPGAGPGSVALVPPGDASADYRLVQGAGASPGAQWERTDAAGARLPPRTLAQPPAGPGAAEALVTLALRLSRAKALLALASDRGDPLFPYRPVLERIADRGEVVDGSVHAGTPYQLALRFDGDPERRQVWDRHFVYLVGIDPAGEIQVLYPALGAELENHLPVLEGGGNFGPAPERIPAQGALRRGLVFRPPFGAETILLIASRDAIPAIGQLQQPGVLDPPEAARGPGAAASRGGPPAAWIVRRLELTSAP